MGYNFGLFQDDNVIFSGHILCCEVDLKCVDTKSNFPVVRL